MIRRLLPCAFLGVLVTACSGGGGSSLPLAASTAAPTGSGTTPQSVAVSIKIPGSSTTGSAFRRHPQYISPNTQSASISVNGGTATVVNLAAGSPNCTPSSGSGRTCTITISAPVGNDTFTELTYQSTTGTGPVLSQNTTSATIAAGTANTVQLVLDGVVASISLSLANPTPPTGVPYLDSLTVNFLDASNAAIIGSAPFENPITLTDSDTTKVTTLSKTTLNSPADAVNLNVSYSGASLATPATFSATASGVSASAIASATLTPTSEVFADWSTYGYDQQRSGFNPYTTGITPTSLVSGHGLHLAWQVSTGGNQTQPLILTNVIANHPQALIVASYTQAQAYDALTGQALWQRTLPKQSVQGCGTAGISGTPVYDKALGALFMVAGNGGTDPNHVVLYELSAASGAILNQVDVTPSLLAGEANDSHAAVSMANGLLYVGTGSDCEGSSTSKYPSWRGRVVAVNPNSMTVQNTFFTTWQVGSQPGNYGGGGVWAWGGVSADLNGNIYLSAGNAETNNAVATPSQIQPPFVGTDDEQAGYAENLVKLSGDLSTVEGANYPGFNFAIGYADLDYTGVPVVMLPGTGSSTCPVLTATQGKGGTLVINNAQTVNEVNSFALSVPSANAYYMGNPAYSPTTGYLYAAIASSGPGSSMLPPGLAAIGGCGQTMMWHAQFGPDSASFSGDNPRSAPTVTSGGVVLIGAPSTTGCTSGASPCGALWAVDAQSGSVLGPNSAAQPLFTTGEPIRMPPTADGLWVWVYDTGGNLYGLTVDSSVPAVAEKRGQLKTPTFKLKD